MDQRRNDMNDFSKTLKQLEESFLGDLANRIPQKWKDKIMEKIGPRLKEKRAESRKNISHQIAEIKSFLRENKVKVVKSKIGKNYACEVDREIGLTTKDKDEPDKPKFWEPKFEKLLFSMAHETGHSMTWLERDIVEYEYHFEEKIEKARKRDLRTYNIMIDMKKLFLEFKAWHHGAQFIPVEYLKDYKKYARLCLRGYLDRHENFGGDKGSLMMDPYINMYMQYYNF